MTEDYNAPSAVQIGIEQKIKIEAQFKRGANWFYWIAGLSLLNAAIVVFDGNLSFVIGLAITQVIQWFFIGFSTDVSATTKTILDLISFSLIIGTTLIFILFGFFSQRKIRWVYITGMVFYALDGLLYLFFKEFLGFGFHIFALLGLYGGFKAMRTLLAVERGEVSLFEDVLLPQSKPRVRDRRYWIKLLTIPALLFILFAVFLTFLLTYPN